MGSGQVLNNFHFVFVVFLLCSNVNFGVDGLKIKESGQIISPPPTHHHHLWHCHDHTQVSRTAKEITNNTSTYVLGVLWLEPSSLRRSGVAVAALMGRRRIVVMERHWPMEQTVDWMGTQKGFGVQTLSRVFRKLWPSTLLVAGGRLYYQTRGRCMVRNSQFLS